MILVFLFNSKKDGPGHSLELAFLDEFVYIKEEVDLGF